MRRRKGRTFQSQGTACAKSLRQGKHREFKEGQGGCSAESKKDQIRLER